MKNNTPLIIAALLASLFTGCSKHSEVLEAPYLKLTTPMSAHPQTTDFGTVEVADGVSSSHVLADGRSCVLTPTILPGGRQIQLEASIKNTNAVGTRHVYSLTTYFTPDEATTFEFDSNNVIKLTLHVK
jgi:hypothetical protein